MHLTDNAGEILKKAWSVRMMAIAALLDGATLALQTLTPSQPPTWLLMLSTAVTVSAFAARFIAQGLGK